jgi:small subunit ribosomal protein S6
MTQLKSMKDEPNTLREYETIFILRPETNQDGIQAVNTRIRAVIDQMDGRLLKLDNWGKRKLAYEVRKQLKGIYLYWQYLGTSGTVEEIERNLRMLDSVVRYYTVLVDEDVVPDARPTEVTDESFQKAATTGPDEEEIVTGAAAARGFGEDEDMYMDEGFGADHEAAHEPPAEPAAPAAPAAPAPEHE